MSEPVYKTYQQKSRKILKDGTEKIYICNNRRIIKGTGRGKKSKIDTMDPELKREIAEHTIHNSKRSATIKFQTSIYLVNKILAEYREHIERVRLQEEEQKNLEASSSAELSACARCACTPSRASGDWLSSEEQTSEYTSGEYTTTSSED